METAAEAKNRKLILQYNEEVWNKGNDSALEQYFSKECLVHKGETVVTISIEDDRKMARSMREAFPDMHWTIQVLLVEGDLVACYNTARGTHAKTGRKISDLTEVIIYRIKGDKITDVWYAVDYLGLYEQLGFIPSQEELTSKLFG